MPRAGSERPSRRLDAILETLRRHGVKSFTAAKLGGVGEGLEWTFRAPEQAPAKVVQMYHPPTASNEENQVDSDLRVTLPEAPIDELDLVAQNRDGLV
jgi:hypothetical protein